MKKLYFFLFLGLLGSGMFAQSGDESCYDKYRLVFENRGAYEAEDGMHDNVVLTIRKQDEPTECILCSVRIKNGEINEIMVYYEDDTKETMEFDYKDNISWTVFNGMSRTRITDKDEKIVLMFTDLIKPKKKKYKKAPLPDFDLNE
ncbi:hypothetical protein [Parvicella tangerina]|uniref:Uncharacterized protein n=1 Tax=Parvicella tangerina TaxID=2829795 RepID=A0A916JLS5_9FLAO|nr:hypothetical protein [Parvicella tangerina]CAG5080414.1 hypothetical protein CRYO30217_01300 [Parvicella tangerina]